MKKIHNEKGMSLIEIMIVLSIIGVIAYALFGDLFTQADNAKIKTTKSQIENLKKKVKLYKMDNAKYPESWDDLISGNLIEESPSDAWGNEIYLAVPGSHGSNKFEIWSAGPDEESDTDDDVVSWNKNSDE